MTASTGAEELLALVRAVRDAVPMENLDRLIAEHRPDEHGRCPCCHSIGCTLNYVAFSARHAGRAR